MRPVELGSPFSFACVDPAVLGQALQAHQQGIAGKRRSRRVGRIAVRGRSQRQYLPQTLARGRKEIEELVSGGAEIADAATRR